MVFYETNMVFILFEIGLIVLHYWFGNFNVVRLLVGKGVYCMQTPTGLLYLNKVLSDKDATVCHIELIHITSWILTYGCDIKGSCLFTFIGLDVHSEACQRFFREGLTISFTKILTDDAVNSWKFNIHHCIYQNCERLVELCVVKLSQDWFPLLDLLAMVFNPNNK